MPVSLAEIGQRAIAAIYAAVKRHAASKMELIETNSWKLIDLATHARAEATLEIDQEAQKRAARGKDARRSFESDTRKEFDGIRNLSASRQPRS